MKLHLSNNEVVEITRLTCAYYCPDRYGEDTCEWNINPLEIIHEKRPGFFAIGTWGCDGYHDKGEYIRTPENFKQMIPISSVTSISDIGEW